MRILLVEDERGLSKALTAILKHNQYSVDAVYDGQAAIDAFDEDLYDLVLLDVMLPKKDGLTVLKEIRKKSNRVAVILLTAKSQMDDKIKGLDGGADDYITKPFETRELLARIRAAVRRTGEQTETILTFGNLTLNRTSYEISVNGNAMRLGHKEYQMLEMMMLSPSTVISAERFMEKIWGYDSETEMSVIWVYLSNLRKKFTELKANVKIRANRSIGYSLEVEND